MIYIRPDEQVLLTMRRHWFVFAGPLATFLILLLIPPIALLVGQHFLPGLGNPSLRPLLNFLLALYAMGLLTYVLILWVSYYLDVWIITDKRIIDVEQYGLFRRQISEIALWRIQNVTIEIRGVVATALGFGDIRIQTAGEDSFIISDVANFYHAKDLIVKYSHLAEGAALPGNGGVSSPVSTPPRSAKS